MMTLEQCLDELYGGAREPLVDPSAIPCFETSDLKRLCKSPLVSVRIVTYNHEPYIRECLESVVNQETDFEYEVVVGEDCSQDHTREICFEFQKRYPDKIRVLWADVNVHNLGGNQARTAGRCRGEYIALLEGDDYWTDPMKLQKQIDLVRKTDAICCVANYDTKYPDGRGGRSRYRPIDPPDFTQSDMFHCYPHTSTYVIRRDIYTSWRGRFPRVRAGYDSMLIHCLISIGKVVMLQEPVSVYRITQAGIATGLSYQEKRLLGIKQYLDLYLHGPKEERHRFGSVALTFAAFFFKRDEAGYSQEVTKKYAHLCSSVFWHIFLRQFWHPRTVRAVLRYVWFRY